MTSGADICEYLYKLLIYMGVFACRTHLYLRVFCLLNGVVFLASVKV